VSATPLILDLISLNKTKIVLLSNAERTTLILVVDDDPSLRQLLNWQLTAAGFRIVEAVDGANGLELFDQHAPDLVLLDIMMPMMTVGKCCARCAVVPTCLVLMLTALTNESDQVAGLDGGADDYVVKPFTLRHLLARIRALLRRTGQSVETLVCGPAHPRLQSL